MNRSGRALTRAAILVLFLASCPTSNNPPYVPAGPMPAHESSDQPTDVTLRWDGGDPDQDEVVYTVFLGTSRDPGLWQSGLVETSCSIGNLEPEHTYYWRVRAEDSHGMVSEGAEWCFTTAALPNRPPDVPSSPRPPVNADNQATSLTLSWKGHDPDGDNLTYDVHLGTGASPVLVAADIGQSSYAAANLATQTAYSWRVVARDAHGLVTSGPIWVFRTAGAANHAPDVPSAPTPVTGSANQPTDLTLTWDCADVDGDALYYDLFFGPTRYPPQIASRLAQPRYTLTQLNAGDIYYWHVRATDEHGAATDGPQWYFTTVAIANRPPATPAVPFGPDRGRAAELLAYLTSTTDPDLDQVSLVIDWGDGTQSTSPSVPSGQAVTLTHAWSGDGTYLIRAKGRDAHGAESGWSAYHEVRIGAGLIEGTVRWRFFTGGTMLSSPTIGPDGTIYVGADVGTFFALYPNGSLKWSYSGFEQPTIGSSAAIGPDGTIYLGSYDYHEYAFTPEGAVKWRFAAGFQVASIPAVAGNGTTYFGAMDGCIYSVTASGDAAWEHVTGGWVISSPAIAADGTVYVGSYDGCLYAFWPDGTVRWACQTGGDVRSSPAIGSDGMIYVSSYDGHLYAIRPDGSLYWRYPAGGGLYSSPVLAPDGTIYVGALDGDLHAVYPDGTTRWIHKVAGDLGIIATPAVAANGTIYVGTNTDALIAFNADGSVRWRFEAGGRVRSSPVIGSDGTVYIGCDDGNLYAINAPSPAASSPWPMFHHDAARSGRVGGP